MILFVNTFPEEIDQAMSCHGLIPAGKSALVAVSGGVDSMVLLRTLALLAKQHDWKLTVAHFNHQLRGKSSDSDEEFVKKSAHELEISCHCGAGDVKLKARENGDSIEMAARHLRHEFFASTARSLGIDRIALGHHADDKIELFFLRLLRGAGPEGLCGLKWLNPSPADSSVQLIRPLLGVDRDAIIRFAQSDRIEFREDLTNGRCDFQRNRIRHKLLPLIRKNLQPSLNSVIHQVTDILEVENDYVRQQAKKGSKVPFAEWHPALQRQFLLDQLGPLGIVPQYDLIERLRGAAGIPNSIRPDASVWRDEAGRLQVKRIEKAAFDAHSVRVDLTGTAGTAHFDGMELTWREIEPPKTLLRRAGREVFDSKKVGGSIVLRHWKPGDRFQPIGLAKAAKLQDLFVNTKVKGSVRRKLVVAATEKGDIFWVEGLRIGERFKLDKETNYALEWSWRRQ